MVVKLDDKTYETISLIKDYVSISSLISNLLNYVSRSSLTTTLSNYALTSSFSSYAKLSNVNTFSYDNIFSSQYLNKLVFLTGLTKSAPFYSVCQVDLYTSNVTVNLPTLSSVWKSSLLSPIARMGIV